MQRYSEPESFNVSETMLSHSYEEETMLYREEMLTVGEALWRARVGAERLEEVINEVDKTPGKRDEERSVKLNSLFMSFLVERYGLAAPPEYTRADMDREEGY